MYEQRLYEKSLVASVIKEVVNTVESIKQKYATEEQTKDQPLKIALKGIQLFLQLIESGQNFIKLFDDYKHPSTLELAINSPSLLKMLYLEKKLLQQKKKMDQNPHHLYLECLEALPPFFNLAPKSFKDLIPFIDPELIDFEIGQANYDSLLKEYQSLITETLNTLKKPRQFTLAVASKANNNAEDKAVEAEEWMDVLTISEAQRPNLPQALISPKIAIEQTIWAKSPTCKSFGNKTTSECKI